MDKLFDFFNWILPRLSWAAEGLGQFFGNLLRSIPYALSWLFANHVTIAELYCLLVAHESLLGILFSGSRAGMLATLLEEQLKQYIFGLHPEYLDDLEKHVILTYLIQGAYHAYIQYRDKDSKAVLLMINKMASAVLRIYTQPADGVKK